MGTEVKVKLVRVSDAYVHSSPCRDVPTTTNLNKERKEHIHFLHQSTKYKWLLIQTWQKFHYGVEEYAPNLTGGCYKQQQGLSLTMSVPRLQKLGVVFMSLYLYIIIVRVHW